MTTPGNPKTKQQAEIGKLMNDLSNKERKVREEARKSLIIIGEPAVLPLVRSLSIKDKWSRWEIAKTLAEMRNPEAAPILVQELGHKDPDIRWLAAEGLIALGSQGLEPLLKALVNKPDSDLLKLGAHHILHDLSENTLHPGEEEYKTLYRLNPEQKQAISGVLEAMENLGSNIVLPAAAKIALNSVVAQRIRDSRQNPDFPQ
jgi:hypothetical protein